MVDESNTGTAGEGHPAGSQLVVKFTPAAVGKDLEARAAELAAALPGGRVVRVSPRGRVVLAVQPGTDLAAAATRVAGEPDIQYAEPDVADRAV